VKLIFVNIVAAIVFVVAMTANNKTEYVISEAEEMAFSTEKLITHFPENEVRILTEVAKEYSLTDKETMLLFAIRKVENGRPGVEMGVGDNYPKHPARRFAGNFEKSLRLQAQWSAGTIKKRFANDLVSFSERYCERADHWKTLISKWLDKIDQVV